MLFDLYQSGTDDNVSYFKFNMMGNYIGRKGDKLSVKGFEGADCSGDATIVADGDIVV